MRNFRQWIIDWFVGWFESYGAILEFVLIAGAVCAVTIALYMLWVAV